MLRIFLAFFYMGITLGIGWLLDYNARQMNMLLLLGFNQFLLSFILYLRSNIAGLQMHRTNSIISVLDRLIMIMICSIILWGGITEKKFRIEWFIYIQSAAYILTSLIAFLIVLRKATFIKIRWNKLFFLIILKRSFPFALLILTMMFYNRIDAILFERMLPNGAEQAGIYAQAYRILDSFNMIAFLFAVLLLPMFAKMLKAGEPVQRLATLSFRILMTPAIIAAVGCWFFSNEIMELLYVEHIDLSPPVLSFLITGFMAVCTTYVYGTLLTANASMKQLNIIALGCAVLNIVLNMILIPTMMAKGSAIATLATQSISAVLQLMVVRKVFGFSLEAILLFKGVLFVAGIIGINLLLHSFPAYEMVGMKNQFAWIVDFVLMIVFGVILAFMTKWLDLKEIYSILKFEQD